MVIQSIQEQGSIIVPDEFVMGSWWGRPLKWRVLRLERSHVLVTTTRVLDAMAYHGTSQPAEWETSNVRAWMNGEFLQDAFTDEDRAAIVAQEVQTPGNDEYEARGCATTTDKVFSLSVQEVGELFASDDARNADGDNPCWWLRSPGGADGFEAYVHLNGWTNGYGYNVDEASVHARPAMVVDLAALGVPCDGSPLMRVSDFGSELLLEAEQSGDYARFGAFAKQFGMDASWQPLLVEHLAKLCEQGDARPVEEFLNTVGSVEFASDSLAQAVAGGNLSVARLLLRHGIGFSGKCRELGLVNDTPALRRARADQYCGDVRNFASIAVEDPSSEMIIRQLVRQDALVPQDYRLVLNALGRNGSQEELFAWMLNPDFAPVGGVVARWSNKRLSVSSQNIKDGYPVSAKALRMLWHAGLPKEDPATARCIAPYLCDPTIQDRQELLNACIVNGWDEELHALLAGKRVFTPNMLAEGARVARGAGKKATERMLRDMLRSIGAGKLAQEG